jgi:hypothetical protein
MSRLPWHCRPLGGAFNPVDFQQRLLWGQKRPFDSSKTRQEDALLRTRQRVAHGDPLAARLFDIEVLLQHIPHVLEHCIEIVAIDRRVVVAVGLREAMRKVAAAGVHELAFLTFGGEVDRGFPRGLPARLATDLIERVVENVECRLREAVTRDNDRATR